MMEMVVVSITVPHVLLIQVMQLVAKTIKGIMEQIHVIKVQVVSVEVKHVMMITAVQVMEIVIHFYQINVLLKEQDVLIRHHYALHIQEQLINV